MSNFQFPRDFIWGTATASCQVEGAANEDGRSPSVWDTFSHTPGKIKHGDNPDVSCDQYHRYKEDVALMKEAAINSYRFSLSWSRILPDGIGRKNQQGIDYYNRLIDELLQAGIQPNVTLFHWDTPQVIEDLGGWPEREAAYYFADYAKLCFETFGDRVKMWTTLNEPHNSANSGYELGTFAPGIKDPAKAFRAMHHMLLGHGLAVKAYRAISDGGQIGICLDMPPIRPVSLTTENVFAADLARDKGGRMWLDPIYGRGYPQRFLDIYPDRPMPILDGDMKNIAGPLDFLGINYYTEYPVVYDENEPEKYRVVTNCYHKENGLGWDIIPQGLLRLLKWVDQEYNNPEIYITENGYGGHDQLETDSLHCHDTQRIEYLRDHIAICAQAIKEGINIKGYYVWSLIDNFEWAEGYTVRFGLVYCDYINQRRVPKDSFLFYREVIAGYERFNV